MNVYMFFLASIGIGAILATAATMAVTFATDDTRGKKIKKTGPEFDWKSPFPEKDGYAEIDLDEIIESVKKNPAAAAAEYNHKKVIFKGRADALASGDIDVKGMLQESKGYSYYTYSAFCRTNGNTTLLDTVKTIDNNTLTTVYVKGMISNVSDCTITVETKDLACFLPDPQRPAQKTRHLKHRKRETSPVHPLRNRSLT